MRYSGRIKPISYATAITAEVLQDLAERRVSRSSSPRTGRPRP